MSDNESLPKMAPPAGDSEVAPAWPPENSRGTDRTHPPCRIHVIYGRTPGKYTYRKGKRLRVPIRPYVFRFRIWGGERREQLGFSSTIVAPKIGGGLRIGIRLDLFQVRP